MVLENPFHDLFARRGACFETLAGAEEALNFGDAAAEAVRLRAHAGLVALDAVAKLSVEGVNARKMLHGQLTNDINALDAGSGCYAAHLTPKGTMICDLILRCDDANRVVLDLDLEHGESMLAKLSRFAMLEDCVVEDQAADEARLLLAGPRAARILGSLLSSETELELPAYHHVQATILGHEIRIVARADCGESGFLLCLPPAGAEAVAEAILAADEDLALVGVQAFDELRIEAGYPRWGRDLGPKNLPPECGIPHAISYTKGCYVGQETVARIKTYGQVNKDLRGLTSDTLLTEGARIVTYDEKDVGVVTSSTYSTALDRPIALGFVHRSANDPGERLLAIGDAHGPVEVTVVALPFVPRRFEP